MHNLICRITTKFIIFKLVERKKQNNKKYIKEVQKKVRKDKFQIGNTKSIRFKIQYINILYVNELNLAEKNVF